VHLCEAGYAAIPAVVRDSEIDDSTCKVAPSWVVHGMFLFSCI
jgi:hypothetical protein